LEALSVSDQRALLAAICALPDEDTPRLAYADWLDEHVGAMPAKKRESVRMRAELIRVQCELARLPPDEEDVDTATRRVELELRQRELQEKRRVWWAKPLNHPPAEHEALVPDPDNFLRGFSDFATGTVSDFLASGEAFFDIGPVHIIRCLNIQGEIADWFLAQQWLTRARRLEISTNIDERRGGSDGTDIATTEKLFTAQTLANLEDLSLRDWEFGPPGGPVWGCTLRSLRNLTLLRGTSHGPDSFARLGELLPAKVRLREFLLGEMHYFIDELRVLADLPQFRHLERLTLGERQLDYASLPPRTPNVFASYYPAPLRAEGVRAITSAPFWRHLRKFCDAQGYGGFTQEDTEELAAAPPAPNLRSLHLTSGQFGIGGRLAALASSPLLRSVTTLNLSPSQVGDDGVTQLAKSSHLNRLVNLQMNNCDIGPKGVKAIAEAPWAANLVRLGLARNPIKKAGVDALVSSGALPRLRLLDVRYSVSNREQQERLRKRLGNGVIL
jgi:uncharacterized protein (TIGR02996 family)